MVELSRCNCFVTFMLALAKFQYATSKHAAQALVNGEIETLYPG